VNTLSQDNIARFDALAKEWDDAPRRVATAKAIANAIMTANRPHTDERAFEFGCGTGLLSLALAPEIGHIVAMDNSAQMLDVLKSKASALNITNVETVEGSVPEHRPDGAFHLIFSSMTLHHIADTRELLATLFDLCRPGGRIALADLEKEDGSFHGDKPGIAHHGFDRDQLTAAIDEAGFRDIQFSTAHTMEKKGSDGRMRQYPIFLATATRAT